MRTEIYLLCLILLVIEKCDSYNTYNIRIPDIDLRFGYGYDENDGPSLGISKLKTQEKVCIGERYRIICDIGMNYGENNKNYTIFKNNQTLITGLFNGTTTKQIFMELAAGPEKLGTIDQYQCNVYINPSYTIHGDEVETQLKWTDMGEISYETCITAPVVIYKKAVGSKVVFNCLSNEASSNYWNAWYFQGERYLQKRIGEHNEGWLRGFCRDCCEEYLLPDSEMETSPEHSNNWCKSRYDSDTRNHIPLQNPAKICATDCGGHKFFQDKAEMGDLSLVINSANFSDAGIYQCIQSHLQGPNFTDTYGPLQRYTYELRVFAPFMDSINVTNVTENSVTVSWSRTPGAGTSSSSSSQTVINSTTKYTAQILKMFPSPVVQVSDVTFEAQDYDPEITYTAGNLEPDAFYQIALNISETNARRYFATRSRSMITPKRIYARIGESVNLTCSIDVTYVRLTFNVEWKPLPYEQQFMNGSKTSRTKTINKKIDQNSLAYVIDKFSDHWDSGVYECKLILLSLDKEILAALESKVILARQKVSTTAVPKAPSGLICHESTPRSLTLRWSHDGRNVSKYKILYWRFSEPDLDRKYITIPPSGNGGNLTIKITDLEPETIYEIEVAASNEEADGEPSVLIYSTDTVWE